MGVFSCPIEVNTMPKKPKRPCSYPGCPRLTDGRYCEEHAKLEAERYEKYDRDPTVRRHYGRAWKRIRDRYISAHPLCEAKYNSLASRYEKLQAEEEGLKKKKDEREAMAENIGAFMFSLYEQEDVITEFDDKLWLASVEKAIIRADEKITFIFRNGSEVTTDFM